MLQEELIPEEVFASPAVVCRTKMLHSKETTHLQSPRVASLGFS